MDAQGQLAMQGEAGTVIGEYSEFLDVAKTDVALEDL